MSATAEQRLTLARVLRPHGVRGEVACEILTDFPEKMLKLREVFLWSGADSSEPRKIAVRKCWLSPSRGGQVVFHFEGVNSVDDAKRLRGLQIQVPLAKREKLPSGSYFVTDLVGCEVWEENASAPLGTVRDVARGTGTPVLEIDTEDGELLVPMAQEICTRIDPGARRIDVRLPEGLKELNRR